MIPTTPYSNAVPVITAINRSLRSDNAKLFAKYLLINTGTENSNTRIEMIASTHHNIVNPTDFPFINPYSRSNV